MTRLQAQMAQGYNRHMNRERRDTQATRPVLAVDLDGTLLPTDLLHESFWAAIGHRADIAPRAVLHLLGGRAALKRWLAGETTLDPAALPYRDEVLAELRAWRAAGGRTTLVTASDQLLAERVAAHLGLFDAVHGSDGVTNLKGARKAAFLSRHYGQQGFVYMGDSRADLAVWKQAAGAITVAAGPGLRARAEAACPGARHIGATPELLRPMLAALRPHQWLKNILVFLPMIAAHRFEAGTIALSALAFIAFCLVSSAVYVLNDLLDLAADRAHPRKRLRPFASGALPVSRGLPMITALAIAGGVLALAVGPVFLAVLAAYLVLTTAYSLGLKREVILDILMLGVFYTLRIAGGAAAAGVELSVWLAAFSLFFFLALAAVKRQAELVDARERGKLDAAGRGYRTGDVGLVEAMAVASGFVSVLVLALYLTSPAVQDLYRTPEFLWGICLVLLYWVGRVVVVAHRGQMHDDPVIFALRDRTSRACLLAVLSLTLAGMLV